MKNKLFQYILFLLAFIISCAAVVFGEHFSRGLIMVVGTPSSLHIISPREAVNTVATERNRLAAIDRANELEPVTTINDEWPTVENNLNIFKNGLLQMRQEYNIAREEFYILNEQRRALAEIEYEQALAAILEWETLMEELEKTGAEEFPDKPPEPIPFEEEPMDIQNILAEFALLPLHFSELQEYYMLTMPDEDFEHFWDSICEIAQIKQSRGIGDIISPLIYNAVVSSLEEHELPEGTEGHDIAKEIIIGHLRTNLVLDEAENTRRWEAEAANYETVIVQEGETIVLIGEIVSLEAYTLMSELGILRTEGIWDSLFNMLGVFVLFGVIFIAVGLYLSFYHANIIANKKDSLMLFTVFIIILSVVWGLKGVSYFFLPILIFPLLISVLIERRCAVVLMLAMIVICYFVTNNSLDFLLFFTVSGMTLCMLSRYTVERSRIFIVALLMTVIQFILSIGIALLIEGRHAFYDMPLLFANSGYAAANGLLVVIISMGSLPMWEAFFGVVTPIKLLDLTNPTNLLLRRLTIEAPGTYHHSLIVANLAETACYDIGANTHLARVGGYYHDVGKLKFPHYFAENLDGENPHDHLDAKSSVALILSHVSYGLVLANEYRLPQFIKDFVQEHHGTTVLQYFYNKAKNAGEEVDEKDFRYPYRIPQSKESACVMLADSVEAAVRSMIPKVKDVSEVENLIKNIIRGKLHDGQLAESDLSIKDVAIIEQSFFRVLKGMYHERIEYPKLAKA